MKPFHLGQWARKVPAGRHYDRRRYCNLCSSHLLLLILVFNCGTMARFNETQEPGGRGGGGGGGNGGGWVGWGGGPTRRTPASNLRTYLSETIQLQLGKINVMNNNRADSPLTWLAVASVVARVAVSTGVVSTVVAIAVASVAVSTIVAGVVASVVASVAVSTVVAGVVAAGVSTVVAGVVVIVAVSTIVAGVVAAGVVASVAVVLFEWQEMTWVHLWLKAAGN